MEFNKFEHAAPSAQTAVDIFRGHWASDLGAVLPGVVSGAAPLFEDSDVRPRIAAEQLGRRGSLAGMRVLELGPLEAAHTWRLEQLGAASVIAVEANAEAYLKCLIVKELLDLRAQFQFGDVIEYLEQRPADAAARFDLVFCSGVLYHMADPLRLIELIARSTDRCFVWTHCYRDGLPDRRAEPHVRNGFATTYWVHEYGESSQDGAFWGGNQPQAAWLTRDDMLGAFRHFGFDDVRVAFESDESPAGPSVAFTARRTPAPLPQRLRAALARKRWGAWLGPLLAGAALDRWLLVLLPLLVQLPSLVHLIDSNPLLVLSMLGQGGHAALLPGLPGWIDPNIGSTTQALGHVAAESWLSGRVPWWNPYTGVGVPLAAETSPGALFLPFVLLLHFSATGLVWLRVALQVVAGLATYELLRQLGLRRGACLVGGVLFAFNGTLAWLPHGPERAAVFLPLILLGVERARARAVSGRPLGWLLIAAGLAWSLYAGFPETAFLDGLFAASWAALRLAAPGGLPRAAIWPVRMRLLGKLVAGAAVALLVSAPAVWPFLHFLTVSEIGGHGGLFGITPLVRAAFPMFLLPYLYGPISSFGYVAPDGPTFAAWGNIGGYLGMVGAVLALVGLLVRRDAALRWLLAGWIVLCLAKTAALPGVTPLLNLIPFMAQTAFYRYAEPSWSLAAIVLAALAVDHWLCHGAMPRRAALGGAMAAALLAAALLLAWPTLAQLASLPVHRRLPLVHLGGAAVFAALSIAWAVLLVAVLPPLLAQPPRRWRALALFGLACVDAIAMFAAPQLSAGRGTTLDRRPIAFLQSHLGLQRFYSIGAIPANYGAMFGIAAINDDMLPVPQTWARHIREALDPQVDPGLFLGSVAGVPPALDPRTLLAQRLDAYRELGLRYVVTLKGDDSLRRVLATAAPDAALAPIQLAPGAQLAGRVAAGFAPAGRLDEVGVTFGTYGGLSDGGAALSVCTPRACASGRADLATAGDNVSLPIPLSPPLAVQAGDALSFTIGREGGRNPVALWTAQGSKADLQAGGPPGYGPIIELEAPRPGLNFPRVFRGATMDIFEVPGGAPYASADPACALSLSSRLDMVADCPTPATLTRRELAFPGWTARIDGHPAVVGSRGIFQTLALPAGRSQVRFTYAPPHIRRAYAAAALGVLWVLIAAALAGRRAAAIPRRTPRA